MQNRKTNRIVTAIKSNGTLYIGIKESLTRNDKYIWVNNKQVGEVSSNKRSLNLLNRHIENNNVLKLSATSSDDGLPMVPSEFIKGFDEMEEELKLHELTLKYTYDLAEGIHAMYAPRSNYRPKLTNNCVKLTIFKCRTKTF